MSYATEGDAFCFHAKPPQTLNQWVTVHITYDGGSTTWYEHGARNDEVGWNRFCGLNGGALVVGQLQSRLGGGFQAQWAAQLDIAYVYVYSSAFTGAEVEQRARVGFACPATAPLAAAWIFDGTAWTNASDISGRGHTMRVVGEPAYARLPAHMNCSIATPTTTPTPTAVPTTSDATGAFVFANAGTCNDLLHNGDETGVDCGGSCSPCGRALSLPGLNATTYAIVQPWHWPQSFTVEARVFFPSGRVSTVLSYAAGTSYNCLMAVPSKVVNEWLTIHICFECGSEISAA